MIKKWKYAAVLAALMISWGCPRAAFAAETAYDRLVSARAATHADGSFRFKGEETSVRSETVNGKTTAATLRYLITGYDIDAGETLMQFYAATPSESGQTRRTQAAFLITATAVHTRSSDQPGAEWAAQDIVALLPKFIAMGTLDQFFMLELLNGDRLALYADYIADGADKTVGQTVCPTLTVDISRTQFSKLAGTLTQDVRALLGGAADGMTEAQIALVQTFARSMLANLDAETRFTLFIHPETGRIVRVDTYMDMADPYGSRAPGTVSRIKSDTSVTLYDFGQRITKVAP